MHESSILQTPPYGVETAVRIKNGYERWPITYPALLLLWQLPISVQARLPLSNLDSEGCATDILELALVDETPLKRFKFSSCRQFSTTPTAREALSIAYLMFLEHDRNNGHWLVH